MRRWILILMLAVLLAACSSSGGAPNAGTPPESIGSITGPASGEAPGTTDLESTISTAAGSILAAANVRRAQAGMPPLIQQADLAALAQQRAEDMAVFDYLGHVDPQTGKVAAEALLLEAGYQGQVAELLYQSGVPLSEIANKAIEAWFSDPDHRLILLGPEFQYTGIGLMGDGEGWVIAQLLTGDVP